MPKPAPPLLRHAMQLLREGRHQPAIDAFRRALAQHPGHADGWYNLAWLLKAQGHHDEALEAYAKALAHGVDAPEEVHLNRAVIYSDHLRRDDEAERELRAALALSPRYLPAWLNLGNLAEERGRREQAIECYAAVLDHAPADDARYRLEALARLAHLRPPADAGDPLLAQLRIAAVSGATGDDATRANLCFALGRALDRLGLHDQAFEAFARGNLHAGRTGPGYDPARTERAIDALVAAFPGATPPPAAPAQDAGRPAPLFICGMFRSGSTLVEQVLAAHPAVVPGGELDLLPRMAARQLAPFPAAMATLDAARAAALAAAYRTETARLFPHAAEAAYLTDKRPDNFLLVGLAKRLFPAAKIIHTVRHPLDNGLSIHMQHLDPRGFAYANDLRDTGHYYGQYRRLMAHWKRLYPDSIHDFDYDAFVRDPQATAEALLAFLDLPWDPRCLEFHRLDNTVKTASYWQVRRPLYAEASGRWRQYRRHLEPLAEALRTAGVDPDPRPV